MESISQLQLGQFKTIHVTKMIDIYRGSPLLPFIHQEALALQCREKRVPILHFWRYERAVFLGARDATLANLEDGVKALRAEGSAVVVRPFGGLAVPADCGVLNVSIILPGTVALDDGFALLCDLLIEACVPYGKVAVGEVRGAYCPGRYDLAMGGIKFAGVAQRKLAGVTVVSAFVNVEPNDAWDREEIMARFYHAAVGDGLPMPSFVPRIQKGCVSSLDELAGLPYPVLADDLVKALTKTVVRKGVVVEDVNLGTEVYLDRATGRLRTHNKLREWY